MNRVTKGLYAALLAGGLSAVAQAAIIPVYQSAVQDGSDYRWTYDASVGTGFQVEPGDYFTIYDFGGLDGNPQMPSGWSYSTADVGPVPILLLPIDDPTIPNVTFTYTGSTAINGSDDIGLFSVDALGNQQVNAQWTSYSHRLGGDQDGEFASDIGSTVVPEQITNPNNPEPATVGILAGGVGILGLRRQKRE